MRQELVDLGVAVHDEYLDQAQLATLLAKDAVFLLPYQNASQSGALYSLLNHGRTFICADVGDLGAFMRTHGLDGLLLKDRSAAAVEACLQYLAANRAAVAASFAQAQADFDWGRLMRLHGQAFDAPG